MSNVASPQQAYRRNTVLSASPGQLVVMLYDGARKFLRQAVAAMEAGDVERAHKALRRAELIIAHLDATIDDEQGSLPARLHAIYAFCLRHLGAGRMGQDPANLEAVNELLGELREAWAQVAEEVGRGRAPLRASRAVRRRWIAIGRSWTTPSSSSSSRGAAPWGSCRRWPHGGPS